MVSDIKQLLSDKNLLLKMAQNARAYAEREHDIKVIASKYAKVLENIGK